MANRQHDRSGVKIHRSGDLPGASDLPPIADALEQHRERAFCANKRRNGDVHGCDVTVAPCIAAKLAAARLVRRLRHDLHRKDMILTAGFNVYPAELERVLCMHPAVALYFALEYAALSVAASG